MKLSKFVAQNKIYLDRSRTYLSYIQLLILFKLFLSDIGITDNFWLIIGFVVSIFIMLIVGYFDTKFGIRSREMENNSTKNPVLMDILKRIKRIENESNNRLQ
jgi:hypothetical protein